MNVEERFLELIGDYYVYSTTDNFPNVYAIMSCKNDYWLIIYDKKQRFTDISDEEIWNVFIKEYKMTYDEVRTFTQNMVVKHFNMKGTTTGCACM